MITKAYDLELGQDGPQDPLAVRSVRRQAEQMSIDAIERVGQVVYRRSGPVELVKPKPGEPSLAYPVD